MQMGGAGISVLAVNRLLQGYGGDVCCMAYGEVTCFNGNGCGYIVYGVCAVQNGLSCSCLYAKIKEMLIERGVRIWDYT